MSRYRSVVDRTTSAGSGGGGGSPFQLPALRRPPPDFHVIRFVFAVGYGRVGQVGNHEEDVPLRLLRLAARILEGRDGIAFRAHLGDLVLRRLAGLLEPADFLGDLVALAAEGLQLLLRGAALFIEREELAEIKLGAAPADRRPDLFRMFSDEL